MVQVVAVLVQLVKVLLGEGIVNLVLKAVLVYQILMQRETPHITLVEVVVELGVMFLLVLAVKAVVELVVLKPIPVKVVMALLTPVVVAAAVVLEILLGVVMAELAL